MYTHAVLSSVVYEVIHYLSIIRSKETVMITRIKATMTPAAAAGATSETSPTHMYHHMKNTSLLLL